MKLYDLAEGAGVSCFRGLVFSAALHFLLPFLERLSWKGYEDSLFCGKSAAHLGVIALLTFPLFISPLLFPLEKVLILSLSSFSFPSSFLPTFPPPFPCLLSIFSFYFHSTPFLSFCFLIPSLPLLFPS